jgi:hypothetical protein
MNFINIIPIQHERMFVSVTYLVKALRNTFLFAPAIQ